MQVIRPVKADDIFRVTEFAFKSLAGVTSLPKNQKLLEERIGSSLNAFNKNVLFPKDELYFFVLEDTDTGTVLGISGIKARTGSDHPIPLYHIEKEKDFFWLKPRLLNEGPTEIAALYIHPDYRKGGFGRLLSFARFMFIAEFPKRFESVIFANLRGIILPDTSCPFWDMVNRPFSQMNFSDVMNRMDNLTLNYKKIMPRYPLCSLFLPDEAIDTIQKTHPHTVPALKLLQEEGFEIGQEIDLLDGGPFIFAPQEGIKTIQNNEIKIIKGIKGGGKFFLISNRKLDFRTILSECVIEGEDIYLTQAAIDALKLKINDSVRISPAHFYADNVRHKPKK